MSEDEDPLTKTAIDLAKSIHPLLADHPAPVVGAALADLLSLLIAGHIVDGNPRETQRVRDRVLDEHIRAVKRLVPLQDEMLKHRAAPPEGRPN
jgi:hypothetical protein